ncbi:hypothetical protein PHLCEN_2v1692 [Hermanssonia centrifuga]|uniref:HMG box domain-containing protein n=1 Tax=Hermanssonia centrifuga TaxID=98765 RepID=A0A2R6RZA2_9APHY|nr:hypothetical protein PHLCEN_2v1692 [Hermanssonia centrifuga]
MARSKKNEDHIPRPPNAFMLYRSDKNRELNVLKQSGAVLLFGSGSDNQVNRSQYIGKLWNNEGDDIREVYHRKAVVAAEEHRRRYPHYKYRPVRKTRTPNKPAGHNESIKDETFPLQLGIPDGSQESHNSLESWDSGLTSDLPAHALHVLRDYDSHSYGSSSSPPQDHSKSYDPTQNSQDGSNRTDESLYPAYALQQHTSQIPLLQSYEKHGTQSNLGPGRVWEQDTLDVQDGRIGGRDAIPTYPSVLHPYSQVYSPNTGNLESRTASMAPYAPSLAREDSCGDIEDLEFTPRLRGSQNEVPSVLATL